MIIPNHGGESAKSRRERASPPGRCGTTRSWACSVRRSGWPAGIGSMRVKISAASTASHFSGSWAFHSQTSAVNLATPRAICPTQSVGTLGSWINAWRRWVVIVSA